MDQKIIVALDAMGGDLAPVETVKGAVDAVKEMNVLVKLVGREEDVNRELAKYTYPKEKIEVVNAEEVISTDEVPTMAIRKKKNSSMVVGMQLVKNGEADAFVSAGSTGALLTGSLLIVGRLPGVERPVLGTCLPTKNGFTFLVDSGANVDCKAKYLEQFGKMGSVYVENVFGKKNPSVALVNIGAEKEKGDSLTKEAYELLEVSDLNFVGNIEPRNIPFGEADVIVCDGFVGNTILKFAEGLSKTLVDIIKSEITKGAYKIAAAMLVKPFRNVKKYFDADEVGGAPFIGLKSLVVKAHGEITKGAYKIAAAMLVKPFRNVKKYFDADEVGGAPFIGLKSLVVKAHGSSNAKAFKNAIRQCVLFKEADIVGKIQDKL